MPSPSMRSGLLGQRLVHMLSIASGPQEASDAVLREVAQALGSPLAVLWRLDPESGAVHWAADWGEHGDGDDLRHTNRRLTFAPGVGLPGRVLQTREPGWVEDIESEADFPRADVALRCGMRSVVAAPLISPGWIGGVIEFFSRVPRPPALEELDQVTMAGRQLAAYLARVGIEDRLRASEESSAAIVRAALDCIVTMDHEGCVTDFNPAAEATFGYRREDTIGRRLAELIIPPEFREAHERALALYVAEGIPTILGRRLELTGLRADGATFPVELTVNRLGGGEPPAFVGFLRDITARRDLEEEQSRLLHSALVARAEAEAAGVRTDDAREEAEQAWADAERGRQRLALLASAGRQMAEGSMDWEATLRAVVASAVPELADWVTLTVVDPSGHLRVAAGVHRNAKQAALVHELGHRYPPAEHDASGPGYVIRTGEIEVLRDVTPDLLREAARDEEHLRLLTALGPRESVVAPLKGPRGVLGALMFSLSEEGRSFDPADVELIASLAARAALHIQNARLYGELAHIAYTLQASLRPRPLPSVPGVELAVRFRPAGEHNEVGGDFYDVFPSSDGAWTAVIGDVSGKGAEAAAITARARHTLQAAAMVADDPGGNLALLNRALCEDPGTEGFCTVVYARLCPGGGTLDVRFANGGHPPPLVLRADGTVESVEDGRGPIVGALQDPEFGEGSLSLERGDVMLLYTDGVTEIRTTDVNFGERRLRATLAAHAGASADEIAGAVERQALEAQSGRQRDDIAVLAVKAGG